MVIGSSSCLTKRTFLVENKLQGLTYRALRVLNAPALNQLHCTGQKNVGREWEGLWQPQ
jgi:hypothetical protein